MVVDDKTFVSLIVSSLKIIKKLFKTDTIIDWEVYSRLTTIFALFTCARNRVGFYREDVRSRVYFSTHLVYFNLFYGSWYFYEELSKLLGADILTYDKVRKTFLSNLNIKKLDTQKIKIGIGHGCSDLSPERMLTKEQWLKVFKKNIFQDHLYEVSFLGGPLEGSQAEEIIDFISPYFKNIEFINFCGKTKLYQSIEYLAGLDHFWGIDSALLHYSRLIGLKVIAFYGPTSPNSLIKEIPGNIEEINYKQVPCSPCVHVTEQPPCKGNNICIKTVLENY